MSACWASVVSRARSGVSRRAAARSSGSATRSSWVANDASYSLSAFSSEATSASGSRHSSAVLMSAKPDSRTARASSSWAPLDALSAAAAACSARAATRQASAVRSRSRRSSARSAHDEPVSSSASRVANASASGRPTRIRVSRVVSRGQQLLAPPPQRLVVELGSSQPGRQLLAAFGLGRQPLTGLRRRGVLAQRVGLGDPVRGLSSQRQVGLGGADGVGVGVAGRLGVVELAAGALLRSRGGGVSSWLRRLRVVG